MREVNINGERSMREVYIDDKQPVTQGEIDDHPVVESDEDMFTFGIFELNTKGKHCTCPTVNALGHKNTMITTMNLLMNLTPKQMQK